MFTTTYVTGGEDEPPPGDFVVLLARLAEGLHLDADLLGTRWSIEGAQELCELFLPRSPGTEPTTAFSRPLLQPDVAAAERMFTWWVPDETREWGRTGLDDESGPITASVAFALVVSAYRPPDNGNYRQSFTAALGDHVEDWLNRHAEWLEVISHVDLQRHQPDGPQIGLTQLHNVALGTTASGDRIGHFAYVNNPVIRGSESRSITTTHWADACRLTNDGISPSQAHLYLRRARTAFRRDDFRAAVIDSCTAAEVALAANLRDKHPLSEVRPDEVASAIDRTSGVVQLFDLHQAMRPLHSANRGAVSGRLAGPRNQAAHDGAPLSREIAWNAIQLATDVVDDVTPLPVPSGRHDQPERGRVDIQLTRRSANDQ